MLIVDGQLANRCSHTARRSERRQRPNYQQFACGRELGLLVVLHVHSAACRHHANLFSFASIELGFNYSRRLQIGLLPPRTLCQTGFRKFPVARRPCCQESNNLKKRIMQLHVSSFVYHAMGYPDRRHHDSCG